ncbi:hypothetical protein RHCRD62_10307 [Rhodococcus sp. RD6.2]|nr:hypothetical protein RHCRD62_10307 [Rhodococcus sp. RD6.2]
MYRIRTPSTTWANVQIASLSGNETPTPAVPRPTRRPTHGAHQHRLDASRLGRYHASQAAVREKFISGKYLLASTRKATRK